MRELRQSTQVIVTVGTAVAVGDGFTPVTSLTLSGADEAELIKANTTTTTDISGATIAAITGADGTYGVTLTTSHTDTLGPLRISINDDSLILPLKEDFMVISAIEWDRKYTALGQYQLGVMDYGTATAADGTTLTLRTGKTYATNQVAGCTLVFTGGTGVDQVRQVVSNTNATPAVLTIDAPVTAPSGTPTYILFSTPPAVASGTLPAVNATHVGGTSQTGGDLAALITTVDTVVDRIEVDTQDLQTQVGTAGAGLTNINLPNQTMDIVGSITGNLSGSVGSVTGAVGSVTGNVGGSVVGSVASVTGDIGGLAAGAITDVETGVAASLAASGINPTDGVGRIAAIDIAEGGSDPGSPVGET